MAAEVIYITDDLQVIAKEHKRPYPDRLRTSCPEGSKFVIRYSTRRRRWEAYDIRRYVAAPRFGQFYSAPPPSVCHENKDSVIGWAMIMP